MAEQKLVNYVIVARTRGFPPEKIRQILREAGWPEANIDEAFELSTKPDIFKPKPSIFINPLKKANPIFFPLILILVAILFISTTFVVLHYKSGGEQSPAITGAAISGGAANTPLQENPPATKPEHEGSTNNTTT